MKYLPYDINSFSNFEEIQNINIDKFNLRGRRDTWDFVVSELVNVKSKNILIENFFSTINLQLYNDIPPILCALIDFDKYHNKNYKFKFSNKIINQILNKNYGDKTNNELFKKNFSHKKVKKVKVLLRKLYFIGNFYKQKVDLIDHNYNSRNFLKKKFNVIYKPSNNFFNFKNFDKIKFDYNSYEFKEIFDESFAILNKIFINFLLKKNINLNLVDNFTIFLENFLKNEIAFFLYSQKVLKNLKMSEIISSSISGFKPSRLIASFHYFNGKKIIKFDDNNGGILHGHHKAAYLNCLVNCTDYYFKTKEAKESAENLFRNFYQENNIQKKINFHSLNYENKNKILKKDINLKDNKYVYFAISFRNNSFHGSGSFHDIDYLNIQNVIFNCLKSKSDRLTYRAHPETLIGSKKNPLEKYTENINFEKLINQGNICIFDSTISSSFWQCILNQNPIILIRHYHVDEKSIYLKRLEERCEIIDIFDPSQTEEILKGIDLEKISRDAIEKSQNSIDEFDNTIF